MDQASQTLDQEPGGHEHNAGEHDFARYEGTLDANARETRGATTTVIQALIKSVREIRRAGTKPERTAATVQTAKVNSTAQPLETRGRRTHAISRPNAQG